MSRSASEPLRVLTEEERKELHRVSRASSEPRIRHQRAVALLAVAEGKSLSEAARLVGWKSHDPVTKVTRRFNSVGLSALDDLPRPGPHRRYGPREQARILQEARRTQRSGLAPGWSRCAGGANPPAGRETGPWSGPCRRARSIPGKPVGGLRRESPRNSSRC